ncbi:MAG TPA: hypothetical protein VGF18_04075, partial [Candidatus Tumulicola sp.]
MNGIELGELQRRAVDAPPDACVLVSGGCGTGKSVALEARAKRLNAEFPGERIEWFRDRSDFARFAFALLPVGATIVDDVEAEDAFARACEPLFAMDWNAFSSEQLDPEIPGLHSPARFLNSAFRLIRRLREQDLDPNTFSKRALEGATEFYGRPPNFVDPRLLSALKREYHDSLAVDAAELQRQYRREVDLVKILAALYRRYDEAARTSGRMTGRDAVATAVAMLRADPASSAKYAPRFALVDDAELLTPCETALLQLTFGTGLAHLSFAGRTVPLVPAAESIELAHPFRTPPILLAAQNVALGRTVPPNPNVSPF